MTESLREETVSKTAQLAIVLSSLTDEEHGVLYERVAALSESDFTNTMIAALAAHGMRCVGCALESSDDIAGTSLVSLLERSR